MDSKKPDLITKVDAMLGITGRGTAVCETHGEHVTITTKHTDKPSGCPECAKDRQDAQDKTEQAELFAKIKSDRIEKKLGSALIPKRFAGKSFADYIVSTPKQEKNLSECRAYADNFEENHKAGRCLLLLGKPGTGKTHLASAIAWQVMTQTSHTAVYRTVGGILQLIKGSYGNDSEYSEQEAYKAFTSPSLMIIDEVGATKPTEFELTTLFAIINGRYEDQLPTIVISNLQPDELGSVLGERSVDRLREGGSIALVFNWDSERRNLK